VLECKNQTAGRKQLRNQHVRFTCVSNNGFRRKQKWLSLK